MAGHTYTTSFVDEMLDAIHDFDSDSFKMALYDDSVSLGRSVTAYTATGEITGTGYTAGGTAMAVTSGYPQAAASGNGQVVRFDDVEWPSSSLTARQCLIYNASKSNKSVLVLDFGRNRTSVGATLAVRFPLSLDPIIQLLAGG